MLGWYRRLSRRAPLATAFGVTFCKGSASDAVAQTALNDESFDWRRNVSFALFSGAYLGVGQHYVYNVAFPFFLGAGRDMLTASRKVLADALVHVPLVYLPLYYPFETVATGQGTLEDGLRRYRDDAPRVLSTYWMTWPPVHFFSFTVLPSELRITFVAGISFLWLIFLSYASHNQVDNETKR